MLKPIKLANKNFLSSLDTTSEEFFHILEIAKNFKNKGLNIEFKNKVLGLIFDKSSTRTRVSFQVAMSRLGGSTIDLNPRRSVSDATAQAIDKEVRDLVDDAHETALNILRNNLPLLESISQKILQEEVIEGEDLKTLLAESKMPA